MIKKNTFIDTLDRHIAQVKSLRESRELDDSLNIAISLIVEELQLGKPLLVLGNGGSSADAHHITAELVGKFMRLRRSINAICLSANTSILTAWSNDDHYDNVFSRQIEAFPEGQAIVLGISTSGSSRSVVNAMKTAKSRGFKTISLVGVNIADLREFSDVLLSTPTVCTRDTQELHILIYHYLCEGIEAVLATNEFSR